MTQIREIKKDEKEEDLTTKGTKNTKKNESLTQSFVGAKHFSPSHFTRVNSN